MTRSSRQSPIGSLSASRNSNLKAFRSLNGMAGPRLGADRSFAATDHRATGERTAHDLNSSVERSTTLGLSQRSEGATAILHLSSVARHIERGRESRRDADHGRFLGCGARRFLSQA